MQLLRGTLSVPETKPGHKKVLGMHRIHNLFRWSLTCLVVTCAGFNSGLAREWADASGRHTWKAEILAGNKELVVLRDRKGELQAVQVSELSAKDQKFVTRYLQETTSKVNRKIQTWTMASGLNIKGEVVGYKSGPVEISYRNGTPYVNRKRLAKIDPVYQAMLPRLIAATEDSDVETIDDFRDWARKHGRKKHSIQVDGVLMKLENGDEYAVPLFLFAEDDRQVLENGWAQWNAKETTRAQKEQQDVLLRAEADEYQRQKDQEDRQNKRIQMMQLGLLAADAGVTSIWEVTLMPGRGMNGRPMKVVVPANDSAAAQRAAVQRHPGYVPGPSRQLSRR